MVLFAMVRKYYEVSCDYCGCAEHFPIGNGSVVRQARSYGWIVTKMGKYFDSEMCYNSAHKKKVEAIERQPTNEGQNG